MSNRFVSASCQGERCTMCGAPAEAKVGEEIMWDDPNRNRHNLTAYVCAHHFAVIMGLYPRRPSSDGEMPDPNTRFRD